MGYDINFNDKFLKEINDFFKFVKDKFINNGILNFFVFLIDIDVLIY